MCGEMIPFVNSPIANYKGEIYNLPFNMNTFSKMFGESDPNKVKQIIQKILVMVDLRLQILH